MLPKDRRYKGCYNDKLWLDDLVLVLVAEAPQMLYYLEASLHRHLEIEQHERDRLNGEGLALNQSLLKQAEREIDCNVAVGTVRNVFSDADF
jgi:hypothetical protein